MRYVSTGNDTLLKHGASLHFQLAFSIAALCFCCQPAAHAQTIEKSLGDGQSRWVQFHISDGRIRTASPFFGRYRNPRSEDGGQLKIRVDRGVGVVNYAWKKGKQENVVLATETGEVRITQSSEDEKTSVYRSFIQPTRARIRLEFGPEDDRTRLEADSVWHMLLEHPTESRDHFYPLLEILSSSWGWDLRIEKIKIALFHLAKASSIPDRAEWAKFVEQLASEKFVERQRAERLLRGYGREVLPYLRNLDQQKLDEEQKFRIKRIVLASYGGIDDTPGRVATWLVGDAQVWLSLMASEGRERRRLATAHLSQILGETVAFDPDAETSIRNKQLEKLRKSLLK